MRRVQRIVLLATLIALAPVVSGCADFDMDKLDVFHLNDKKKLPGEREPVFPGGVPGVTQGIPPEYLKGNEQEQPGAAIPIPAADTAAAKPTVAAEPPKAKPKPKKRVVRRKPKPKPKPAATAAAPASQPAASSAASTAPWPAPAKSSNSAPWPAAPPPGSFTR